MQSRRMPILVLCICFQPKRWLRINWLNCRISRNASTTVSECSRMTVILRVMQERRSESAGTSSLTNPDMLHTGILPHHTKWMRLFENLRYIVLDELHTYRGVFA